MIHVSVRIGGGLGGIMGTKVETLELMEGTKLLTLIRIIGERTGEDLQEPTMMVVINGTKLNEAEKREMVLKDGDIVSFFRALVGG